MNTIKESLILSYPEKMLELFVKNGLWGLTFEFQ